jgi:hypothetical protein
VDRKCPLVCTPSPPDSVAFVAAVARVVGMLEMTKWAAGAVVGGVGSLVDPDVRGTAAVSHLTLPLKYLTKERMSFASVIEMLTIVHLVDPQLVPQFL